jgi:hypothetical protein
MAGRVNGFSLAYTAIGGIVLWSGIKGTTISATFRSLIAGQPPGANTEPVTAGDVLQSDLQSGTSIPGVTQGPPAGVAAGGSGTPTANKALGALLAAGYGWGPGSTSWPFLETGWQEESGWNQYAANVPSDPYNHAYGIPQANPGSKMASAGSGWKSDPATQINWGLSYIKAEYGSPAQVPGWTPNGPAAGYQGY